MAIAGITIGFLVAGYKLVFGSEMSEDHQKSLKHSADVPVVPADEQLSESLHNHQDISKSK